MLECNLIKEHTPKYNTMLRDDKTYPYIRVTVQEDFPRVLFPPGKKISLVILDRIRVLVR